MANVESDLDREFQAIAVDAHNLPGPRPALNRRLRILIGVCGTSGAIHIPQLIESIVSRAEIRLIRTKGSSMYFRSDTTLDAHIKIYSDDDEVSVWSVQNVELHEQLKQWADDIVVIPASSDILTKVALGFSDDLLTRTIKGYAGRLHIALDMDTGSYLDPLTSAYIQKVRQSGHEVLDPPIQFIFGANVSGRMGSVAYLRNWIFQMINPN